ncbi:MAG TPA: thermonuclease family protein [Steroidobacteraceae bacterium]|nr:thermonuclease family protein [Steroidobacteraceae bacterium]
MRASIRLPLNGLLLCVTLGIAAWDVRADERTVLRGVVVGVIDGDTADVRLDSGMIRIRFHAIDAPESGQPYGQAAKQALSTLIFGRQVEVEPFEQDRYDRLVARVWLDRLDVNAELVKRGYAWTYRRYADDPAYCTYEQAAREQRLGLWRLAREERVAPWEWRQRRSRTGPFTDYSGETVATCVAALGRRAGDGP